MRDGVKLAVDLYVPKGMRSDEKIPTILHQTRYHRSMQLRWPFRIALRGKPLDHTGLFAKRRKRFLQHGYAWVDVDVRGSGASHGTRICPWSPDEIRDGAEVVDWILSQPWSNGHIGALGISYSGTTAEFLLANHHPAVKAIAPRFALFDAYTDIAFPGGIHASWFTAEWHRMNNALDRNAPHEIAGRWVKLFVTGVQPVDEDPDRSMRAQAIVDHADNYNVHTEASSMTYRDDVSPADRFHGDEGSLDELVAPPRDCSGSIGLFSPHNYFDHIEAAGVAIYSYSGWFDGGYAHAAIKRYLNVRSPGSRLILGPWNHGGGWNIDPRRAPKASRFDHDDELLRFFNHHLEGDDTGIADEKPVHYYTVVEGKWKAADCWPPPGSKPVNYYFEAHGSLASSQPTATNAYDTYRVDYTAASGAQTRWRHQTVADSRVRYTDRKAQDEKLLVFDSAPLDREIEVTGHPIITLFVTSTHTDGNFIAYLEDVDDQGRVSYVTEGLLRAIHRKLADSEPPHRLPVPYRTFKREDALPLVAGEVAKIVFDLLPTSYLFLPGHRLRVALAGADASHFTTPSSNPPTLQIHRDSTRPSHIELPVMVR